MASFSVTHAKSNTIADWSGTVTVGNSTGGTTTAAASDLVRPSDWNSGHAVAMTLSASDIPSISFFEPWPLHNTNSTVSAPGIGTWYLQPIQIPFGLSSGQLRVFNTEAAGFLGGLTYSATSTGSFSQVQTFYNRIALYTQGTSDSSSRLGTFFTTENQFRITLSGSVNGTASNALTVTLGLSASFPAQYDISGGLTYSTTAQTGTRSSGASTAPSSFANSIITGAVAYLSGAVMEMIAMPVNLPAGAYWLGHMFTSSSASSGTRYTSWRLFSTCSRVGLLENALNAYVQMGKSVSNTTSGPQPFQGFLASTTSAATSVIATSDVRYTTGRIYWNYARSAY